jgi:glycosyltransferase involved in cell wall biosynthesis
MRVALLSASARAGDAIGNQVAEKLAFFRDRAADVRVFVEDDQRLHPAVQSVCHVVRSCEPRGDVWRFLRGADLVVAEFGQYYALLSLLPMLAGGKSRILLDYHGITPPELWGAHNREALVKGLEHRGLAWAANATLTHSSFTHDELMRLTGLPRERLPCLGFPIDRNVFTPGAPARDLRRSLGLGDGRVLLFVGRLAPNKRPLLLVEVLPLLADLTPDVHVVIVGDASDLYQAEAQRCLQRARQLGLTDRVHIAGPRTPGELLDFYRVADVLVVPSLWESFCIPVVEAMACGLPVVAARSTALPETVASAGLTFTPDDPADLARQLRRVLTSSQSPDPPPSDCFRVAVVSPRFGSALASGVEASLTGLATALQQAGCAVEVFTTCARAISDAVNELPAGTTVEDGLVVHRFPVEPVAASGQSGPAVYPFRSAALLAALGEQAAHLDAIVVGPYLLGLSADVAQTLPDLTVLLPCFHDEPLARQECWQQLYGSVAAILYHTVQEQSFAERVLGFNHPGSAVVGTLLAQQPAGDAQRGQALAGSQRYVLYSGRYAVEKNLPLLLDHARRFSDEHGGKVRFVFTGCGQVMIPHEQWAFDLGVVDARAQCDLLAGALAVVQLSTRESLSLVALEAWAQATPVIAQRQCAVLAEHIERGGGGLLIDGYDTFAAAVGELLENPGRREQLGQQGQSYVRERYGSAETFQQRLLHVLRDLRRPLAARMRERGLERAALFDRSAWRQQFGAVVERVLDHGPRDDREELLVKPRSAECTTTASAGSVLVAVRVHNRGTQVAVAEGPGRSVLGGVVLDAGGHVVCSVDPPVPLPALLMPGRALSAALPLGVPQTPGEYNVHLWARRVDRLQDSSTNDTPPLNLLVQANDGPSTNGGCQPILDEAQAALVEADRGKQLPCDYTDITQGLFAGVKKCIKAKLLGNFKKAYVDVLSRQQSACNQQLVGAVQALVDCCATLDHAVRSLQQRVAELESSEVSRRTTHEMPGDRSSGLHRLAPM